MEYEVTKCICYDTTFKEMKEIMEKNDLKTLRDLQQYIDVGLNCKLCVPYIEKMIETGRTGFSLDDVPSPNM